MQNKLPEILLILLTLYCFPVRSQELAAAEEETAPAASYRKQPSMLLWGTLGIGAVVPGLGGLFRLTYAWDKESSLSLKAEGGAELNIFGPINDVSEFSLYYGRHYAEELFLLRAAAGPAYFVRNKPNNTYERMGIGFEAEAMLKYKFIGFGFMFTYMLAQDISQPGMTANLSIGKLD